jgi:hypothetical protein
MNDKLDVFVKISYKVDKTCLLVRKPVFLQKVLRNNYSRRIQKDKSKNNAIKLRIYFY